MIVNVSHAARSPRTPAGCRHSPVTFGRAPQSDGRWPLIAEALATLREAGRHSVRIVDADCGTGALLIHAVRHARSIGFTAIEGRGIDGAPALVARARLAAARLHDAAIGLCFDRADLLAALGEEAQFPADILLLSGKPAAIDQRTVVDAASRAAHLVLVDDVQLGASKDPRV